MKDVPKWMFKRCVKTGTTLYMLARSVLWQNTTLVWRIFFIRLVMFCFTALVDDIVILSEMCQWRTVLQNVQQLCSSKAIQACVQSSGTFPPLMHVYLLLLLASPPILPPGGSSQPSGRVGRVQEGGVGGNFRGNTHSLIHLWGHGQTDPGAMKSLVGARDFQINGGRRSAGSFPHM